MFEPYPGKLTSKLCKKGERGLGKKRKEEVELWALRSTAWWPYPITDGSPKPFG